MDSVHTTGAMGSVPAAMKRTALPLSFDTAGLSGFCREHGIRRLSVFGSAVREDFDPARSDVDVLVEFSPGRVPGFRFEGYGETLGRILGRAADVSTPAMLSPQFRDQVLREAVTLYEQA